MGASPFFLSNLRCEYLVNPLGIDVLTPRLSWWIQSDRRGAMQSAYRVVATDAETGYTMWDSGKVISDQAVHIEYAGKLLRTGQRIEWKVMAWDEHDIPSPWSDTAWWEMGLLHETDWIAEWIGAPWLGGPRTISPCPYLRKEFDLALIKKARLYITALGLFEVYINGQLVSDDVLNPGWTDYRKRVRYRVYDVTDLLVLGTNAIGVILGDGWYCGNVAWQGRQIYGDRPKLLAQLLVELTDGIRKSIVTDHSWKVSFGPILESDLLMGESYDARLEMVGWDQPGFDDRRWQKVEVFPDAGVQRIGVNTPMVKRIEELQPIADPVEIPGFPSSKWIFDFGQNMVGHVRMKVRGPRGVTVTLRHGEMLNSDGTLYTENLRTARQIDCYTLKGEGVEIFEPRFTFHGFRYVEVSGLHGKPGRDLLTGIVVHSATPVTGSFECSDPLVNQLHQNILWGQKGNFVDVPTDCPQRDERLGWTGDAQVFIRTATFNMDVAGFYTKWQQDLADSQHELGAVPPVAPNPGMMPDGGPAWADAFVICPWTIYLTYGDRRLLETHYQSLQRFIDFLIKSSNNYIRPPYDRPPTEPYEWLWEGFGDWLAQDGSGKVFGGTPKDLIGTAFFAYCARLMAQIAFALGRAEDAQRYADLFQDVRKAFLRRFVTPDGLIIGQTQTAYVLALNFDLIPEEMRQQVAEMLVRDIESRNMHLSTGFVGTPYLPFVLTREGYLDIAYALLLQKTSPSWLYPVTQGATTIWERWDGWTQEKGFQDPGMNSFNHYAYGSIGAWLHTVVAGIEADFEKPGYKHVLLHPRPGGDLSYARATYASVHGLIESYWRKERQQLIWEVTVPPNTTATVLIPVESDSQVSESGKPLEKAEGISAVHRKATEVVCNLKSGKYSFTIEPFGQ